MSIRRKTGGTLAFVAAAAIIIVLVGIGFFLFARALGGGQEAQQATDSGNLNVAKQVLIHPALSTSQLKTPAGSPDLPSEFGGCFDPSNNSVDLQYYNKIVGKAFLVALNAAGENTSEARSNAQAEAKLVQGRGGIGDQLTATLTAKTSGGAVDNFFNALAGSNSARMLNVNTENTRAVNNDTSNYRVSYMLQNAQAPSNLFIDPAVVDPNAPRGFLTNANDAQVRNSKTYLCGYTPINTGAGVAGASLDLQFVPLRPGEPPHLVGQDKFANEQKSPLSSGNSGSAIPPNAYGNGSLTKEKQTASNVAMRSSAIVGVVDTTISTTTRHGGLYPASIPHGFVIVDNNQGNLISTFANGNSVGFGPTTVDKFDTTLMGGVTVALDGHNNPYFDSSGSAFTQLTKDAPTNNAGKDVPMSDATGLSPSFGGTQSDLNALANNLAAGKTINCNDSNSGSAPCSNIVNSVPVGSKLAKGGYNDAGGTFTNLMPVEALKAAVISIRGGAAGCASTNGLMPPGPVCGPLKEWNPGSVGNNINFGSTPTLRQLFNETNSGNIQPAICQRFSEMAGRSVASLSDSALSGVLAQQVPPGTARAIYFDGTNFQMVSSFNSLPAGYVPSTFGTDFGRDPNDPATFGFKIPDGPDLPSTGRTTAPLDNVVIDNDGDGGYPHPWDCEYTGASSIDKMDFVPSSGYENLLGVIKVRNCVNAPNGTWCCPC